MGCSLALGLFQLGEPSIWLDEAYTAERADHDWAYGPLTGELMWLYYVLVKTWALIAGTSEFALRFPSVVGAVVAVALLYGLARKMLGEQVAFIASLLFALNPFVVKWSQQARAYSILLVLVIASTWLLLRALDTMLFLVWAEYALVVVLLIHWHPFSALVFLPVHVLVAWRCPRALVAVALALVWSIPWLLNVASHPERDLPTSWIATPDLASVGKVMLTLSGALVVGLVLALVGAALVKRHRRLLFSWAALPAVLSLVASLYDPVFQDRYLIVSCPAFAILGAVAIVRMTGRMRRVAVSGVAFATLVSLVLWYAPEGGDNWRDENWRSATELVMSEGGARVTPGWADGPFRYYGDKSAQNGWVLAYGYAGRWPGGMFETRRDFGQHLRALRRPRSPNSGR